ncbi:MAG: hypothetical protein GTO63_13715, partial [Anaerolineae bacterium]|nr:hypothetical protein [Anaerolineae bacterium]NIN95898.1 hypothetical protein [Anaerolineae bacterium]NIQ78871.1 hypothetical protein [Anaerolineae bacterium]
MKRCWRRLAYLGIVLCVLCSPFSSRWSPLQGAEETRGADWLQTSRADFSSGTLDEVQLLDYADGALSLAVRDEAYRTAGVYTSPVKVADFPFNAIGVQWHAQLPPTTDLEVSARVSTDGEDWLPWQEVIDVSQEGNHFYALAPLIVESGTYLQYRVALSTDRPTETPLLEDVTLT